MNPIIGCDAHKRYSLFAVLDTLTLSLERTRVNHQPRAIYEFLSSFPEGTPVALETVGNYYWIVDEIEAADCIPLMAHAVKAKVMMGNVNKTDKLDAEGLAILLRSGTLPTVWIPPGKTRDERELPRTRMALSKLRTVVKNRIHATLAKYNLSLSARSDLFLLPSGELILRYSWKHFLWKRINLFNRNCTYLINFKTTFCAWKNVLEIA